MKKVLVIVLLISFCITLNAQQKVAGRKKSFSSQSSSTISENGFFGTIFSDYSYVFQEPQSSNLNLGMDGANKFDFRRAQVGYNFSFNKAFSTRIVYDASINMLQEGALAWNYNPWHSVTFGMSKTTVEATDETIFGYRSLAPMILTMHGYGLEYDKGIIFSGKLNPQGSLYYSTSIANGSTSTIGTEDKLKSFSINAGFMPNKSNVVELYANYENVGGGRSTITGKLVYGLMMSKFSFGAEGFYRLERKFAGVNDVAPAGGSLFGWFEMVPTLRGVLRVDGMDNDLNQSKFGYQQVYVNAGLDYTPLQQVHIIPNIVYVKELKKGNSAEIADYLMARITAAVYFPDFK
jgi:hypothetical protein